MPCKSNDQVVPVHTMKMYRWNEGIAPTVLNLSTKWRSAVSLMWCLLDPPGHNLQHPFNSRLGGPRASLDVSEKRKLLPHWDSNPRLSSQQTNHYNDSAIPAPVILFWACHNQKYILSLLTLDNSEQLPQSSFSWYHHDWRDFNLGPDWNFLKRLEVYFSYTDIWTGHLF